MSELADAVGMLIASLLLVSFLWTAYLLAGRLTAQTSTSVRWSATAIVAFWLLAALFHTLAPLSLFRLSIVLPIWIAAAAMSHVFLGRAGISLFAGDLSRLWKVLSTLLRSPVGWPLLLGGVLLSARVLRGLVAPPLAWDSLTYHLLRAGRWVQAGGFAPEVAPDAWGYYEHYPLNGDLLWAWAMLPVNGDALLAPAGLLVWFSLAVGAYAMARELGAAEIHALMAAAFVGFTPAVVNYLTTSYVNNTVLALFLLGAVFVSRSLRSSTSSNAALAIGALGFASGAQHSAIPLLLLGLALVEGAALLRRGLRPRTRAAILACSLLALSVAGPTFLRAWKECGSPLYPFALHIGKLHLPGNEEFLLVLSGKQLSPEVCKLPAAELLKLLFYKRFRPSWEHLNLGPASLFVAVLGMAGAVHLLRRRGARGVTLFLLGSAAVTVAGFLSDTMVMERSYWAPVSGRFLTPALAALALLATPLGGRMVAGLLSLGVLVNLAFDVPRGWSVPDLEGLKQLLLPLLVGIVLAACVLLWSRRHGRLGLGLAAAALLLAAPLGARIPEVRRQFRYPIYEAATNSGSLGHRCVRSCDADMLLPTYVGSWPIWKHLDDGEPHRIAYAAGWEEVGHNWYRYPLLGSRLQNQVLYVSPVRDGSIIDYRKDRLLRLHADRRAWIRRLIEERVEIVVVAEPAPLEAEWLQATPRLFHPVAAAAKGFGRAYRFDREAAAQEP